MSAAIDLVAAALGGGWRPVIWASVGPGAVTLKHIDLLQKLCGKFGSDSDNERAVAARLANDLIGRLGLTWRDVIRPPGATTDDTTDDSDPQYWACVIRECQTWPQLLSGREVRFLDAVAAWVAGGRVPSEKQRRWLVDILSRAAR